LDGEPWCQRILTDRRKRSRTHQVAGHSGAAGYLPCSRELRHLPRFHFRSGRGLDGRSTRRRSIITGPLEFGKRGTSTCNFGWSAALSSSLVARARLFSNGLLVDSLAAVATTQRCRHDKRMEIPPGQVLGRGAQNPGVVRSTLARRAGFGHQRYLSTPPTLPLVRRWSWRSKAPGSWRGSRREKARSRSRDHL